MSPIAHARHAVFPGTFDPITSGHLDVIRRGAMLFDRLTVGVAKIVAPKKPLFSAEERRAQIMDLISDLPNVDVVLFDRMTVDCAREVKAGVILRGIRTFSDFEYEFQLALANRAFGGIETMFIMASAENAFVRSTLIKEAVALGADVGQFVPESVAAALHERLDPQYGQLSGLRGEESK